jgi:uncharacterized protein YukE
MTGSFFNSSNVWFGYLANFFFAAAGFGAIARFIYKLVNKHQDKKMDDIKTDVDAIKEELKNNFEEMLAEWRPNSGSSSKDQMNRMEAGISDLKKGQDVIHERIDKIKEDFAEHKGYHRGLLDGEA